MNFGFNSNVRLGDAVYHVQTEDRGPAHPFLDTVVYLAGRVVYKRKTSYEKFVKGAYPESLAKKLHERLAQQHRDVIAELEAGNLPFQAKEKEKEKVRPSGDAKTHKGLHLRLVNPQSWLSAGSVTLEIELSEGTLKQRIGGAGVQASVENEQHRLPCGKGQTDAKGLVTLKFPMPSNVADGSSLVVRASDGSRRGELRFRLKIKPREKRPAPVTR